MDEDGRAALRDALIRESVALGALALLMFALGPGRVLVPAWIAAARRRLFPVDPYAAEVAEFAREVSEHEHETARQDRRSAGGGNPCGCGLPPVGHR